MSKIKFIISSLIFTVIITSCGQTSNGCDENVICYTQRPTELIIDMDLSQPSGLVEPIEVKLYEGYFDDEDKIELLSFTTSAAQELITVPVDNRYSASAKYVFEDRTVIAVTGDRINAESFRNCELTCWNWDDIPFDLRLKD
jgi:hypothetical protein